MLASRLHWHEDNDSLDMEKKIDPADLIQELTVEELCESAEEYFASIDDYTFHMVKPFGGIMDAPELLYQMSLLLSGLRLGKSMTVLDFGAGTCWFSRFLNQMHCATISVDPSTTALRIGEELFERLPILGESIAPPRFLPFDGHRIDLPDASVDRIVCFDAFHHVPNVADVLREFHRVLKDGGIVGFSEPGRNHSQNARAQYEMRHYGVLENDIRLDEIKSTAEEIGFGELRVKMVHPYGADLSYKEYQQITRWRFLPPRFWSELPSAMRRTTIFFFTKGTFALDSRSHLGLRHTIEVMESDAAGRVGQPLGLTLRLVNVGQSKWLHRNVKDIGVVQVGVHLYDAGGRLLDLDFVRGRLDADVPPGESVVTHVPVTFSEPGTYELAIDLVAEHVCWFENLGCRPARLEVEVV